MSAWGTASSPAATADSQVVRAVAWARVVLLVTVAGVGSFLTSGDQEQVLLVVGLVWVPWATVVLLAADLPDRRLALHGGPLGDIAGLVAVQLVVPEASPGVLFGYLGPKRAEFKELNDAEKAAKAGGEYTQPIPARP